MNIKSFKSKLVGAFIATGVALTTVTAAGAPATAADPEAQVALVNIIAGQNPTANLVVSMSFDFNESAPAGSNMHVSLFSCGRFLTETTKVSDGGNGNNVSMWLSPTGAPDFSSNAVNSAVGPSIEYYIDVVEPGLPAYHIEGSTSAWTVKRPSCGGSVGNSTCVVKSWSKKKGDARVGRTVSVTKTKESGCKVSYKWYVGGKKVKTGKSLNITRGMKGKPVKMLIVATGGGAKTAKSLNFGRVSG